MHELLQVDFEPLGLSLVWLLTNLSLRLHLEVNVPAGHLESTISESIDSCFSSDVLQPLFRTPLDLLFWQVPIRIPSDPLLVG